MKKITRKALLTAKAYRPGKASGGSTKKKTYTLVPDISRREIRAVSPTGSEVGYLAMEKYGDAAKNNEVFNMAVKPTWQRQGIMTALHNEAEKHFGTINPSRTLSDDGFAFWKSYRPDAVKNSYRFHADRLMGKPVSTPRGDGVISSVGDKVMIAEKDGGTTFMVPNEISGQMFEQAQTEAAQEQQPQDDINKATGGSTGYADGGSTGKLPERVVNFKNFYSRGAEAARQLSQKKGSPQQMRAMLVKAGVKPEEFTQSGFDDAFSGKPSVTSEELFQHFYSKMPNIGVDKLLSEDHSSYDASDPDAEQPAQFEDYTLPGIVNYREHRLRLPETNNNFSEKKHWPGQKNVVAHIRMGDRIEPPDLEAHDRTVEKMLSDPNLTQSLGTEPANWGSGAADLALSKGTITKEEAQNLSRAKGWRNNVMKGYKAPRALHVEEIQSDWAQAGRKHGFQDLSTDGPSDPNKPPQGPFVNSTQGWTSLALKHAFTEAVNGGYNKLVLSPGQANADMYGLDGERGSGMKSFYDQILPTQMNKLAKSLDPDHPGVQMFSHDLPADYTRDEGYKGHALEITDGMRDAVKKGLPMYKDGGEVEGEGDGDTPAQNAADHIAFLLREDRAKEVTDDLMGQADPKRLHEHYESGNTGMQMPMDEDSRMDRAKALGFDVKAYRGQTGDPGASLNTVRTEGKTAGTGSWATSDPDIAATYSGRENPVSIPMMIKSGVYQAHDFGGKFWGEGPEGKTTDELARASNAPGAHFKNITDVGPHLWNRANVQKRIPETADSFAIKDPKTVRSMFARFDPRLAHLSHLSAATGGAISEKANGGGVNRHLVSSANPMVHKAIALARNLTRR